MFYLRRSKHSKLIQLPETFKDLIPALKFELKFKYLIRTQQAWNSNFEHHSRKTNVAASPRIVAETPGAVPEFPREKIGP